MAPRIPWLLVGLLGAGCAPGSGILDIGPVFVTDDDDDAGDDDDSADDGDDDDDAVNDDDDSADDDDYICTVDLVCDDSEIWDQPKRNCTVVIADDEGDERYNGFAGLERRGRSSLDWAKSNYSMEFWERESIHLVTPFSRWTYDEEPTTADLVWSGIGFDDANWNSGNAPFGWENTADLGVNTFIDRRGPTSRYRTTFEVVNPGALDELRLSARFDDGAVFFLNGVEVARLNVPDGPLTPETLAADVHSGQDEVVWDEVVVTNVLQPGVNVLAVELHQIIEESADAIFDAALTTKPPTISEGFFDMGGEADWILGGAYVDLTQYRNPFLYDLFVDFAPERNYAPETKYCELTLNGDWRGLYQLTEKIKRDDDRLDLVDDGGAGGSFIVKLDDTRPFYPTEFVRGGFQLEWPKESELTEAGRAEIFSVLQAWEVAAATNNGLWDILDMESAVDWVLLQQFGRNGDMYNLSMFLVRNDFGKLTFVPWDMDLVFGLGCGGSSSFDVFTGYAPDLVNGFRGDPVFRQALEDRWFELREGVMSDASILARLDAIKDLFGDTIHQNFERWPEQEMIGADDWVLDFPSRCPTFNWDDSDERARDWIFDRLNWLDRNIDRYPG